MTAHGLRCGGEGFAVHAAGRQHSLPDGTAFCLVGTNAELAFAQLGRTHLLVGNLEWAINGSHKFREVGVARVWPSGTIKLRV